MQHGSGECRQAAEAGMRELDGTGTIPLLMTEETNHT